MDAQKVSPLDVLSKNLAALIEEAGISQRALAAKVGIDPKNVNNMVRRAHKVNLVHIEAVAEYFGLSAWQLLRPGLNIKSPRSTGDTDKLARLYTQAPESGRAAIMQVAEMAAKYEPRG